MAKLKTLFTASHQTPAKILTQALISAMTTDKNIQKFWTNGEIVSLIVEPLLHWPQFQHSARALNLCQILAAWLKTPSGKSFAINFKTGMYISMKLLKVLKYALGRL